MWGEDLWRAGRSGAHSGGAGWIPISTKMVLPLKRKAHFRKNLFEKIWENFLVLAKVSATDLT